MMKNVFRKLTAALIALILMLALFAACGNNDKKDDDDKDDKNSDKNNVTVKVEWYGDIEKHWQLNEAGEKIEEGKHVLKNEVCKKCNAMFYSWNDEETYFSMPDKHGNIKYRATFNPSNTILSEEFCELKYNEDDILLSEKWTYANGTLIEEVNYAVIDGTNVIKDDTFYYPDGTKIYTEYDSEGYAIKDVYYDEAGNVEQTNTYENEYDINGNRVSVKQFNEGVLISENFFENEKVTEDGYTSYMSKVIKSIYYDSDGCKTVTNYVNETPVEEIEYDKDGAEICKILYTNDDDGNTIFSKTYEGGVLVKESTYALYSGGWGSYEKFITEYESDGSKTVYEYDELYNVVSVTKYDANGKVVN